MPFLSLHNTAVTKLRSSKFLSAWRRPPLLAELHIHNDNQLYWIWVFCFCTIVTAVLVWWFLLTILSPTAGKSGQKQYPIKQFKKQTSVELIDKHYEGHQRTIFEDFAQRPILNLTGWVILGQSIHDYYFGLYAFKYIYYQQVLIIVNQTLDVNVCRDSISVPVSPDATGVSPGRHPVSWLPHLPVSWLFGDDNSQITFYQNILLFPCT